MRLRTALGILIPLLAGHVGAQTPQCDITETACLEQLISSQCMSLESDAQTCSEFRSQLLNSPIVTESRIQTYVGATYLHQAQKTSDANDESALYDSAEQTLLGAVELDPENMEAYLGLFNVEMARRNFSKAADYLRIVYESQPEDPFFHRLYINALGRLGSESTPQIIDLTRQQYDRFSQAEDPYRWRYAVDLSRLYQMEAMTAELNAFRAEIIETINLPDVMESLSFLRNTDAADVESSFTLLCNQVVAIIGPEACMQGITAAIAAIPDMPDAQTRTDVAGAVVTGISEIGKEASMGNLDRDWQDWVQQFDTWVTSLEQAAGESARLYEIRAVMTTDSALKRSYMESSVRLEPDEWHYRLRLGQLYMDLEEYALAAEQFEEALSIVTDETEAERIAGWLERARGAL